MSTLEPQSRIIIAMLDRGATFEDVEADVINTAHCDDDEKAALWLLAWSYIPAAKQRYEANQHRARSRHPTPTP